MSLRQRQQTREEVDMSGTPGGSTETGAGGCDRDKRPPPPPPPTPPSPLARRLIQLAVAVAVALVAYISVWGGVHIGPDFYSVDAAMLQDAIAVAARDLPGQHGSAMRMLASTFVQSSRDGATEAFLAECAMSSKVWKGRARHWAGSVMQRAWGWSHNDALAYFGHMTMFPVSQEQLRRVLTAGSGADAIEVTTMLDIGAGSGTVTSIVAAVFGVQASHVTTIETSEQLRRRLAERSYRSLASFDELPVGMLFERVVLFHVLDRCDNPRKLLGDAARHLAPGGALLLATPLPFCAKVHFGSVGRMNAGRKPRVPLLLPRNAACQSNPSFEVSVAAFVTAAIVPLAAEGLELAAWTRLPYLSSHVRETHVALHSVLFVLRRRKL